MPIEIKELVIRAVTQREDRSRSQPASESRSGRDQPSPPSPIDQAAIVEAAVKEVMRILRAGRER